MILKIWFGKAGAMSLYDKRHLTGKSKHFVETDWMIRLLFLDH